MCVHGLEMKVFGRSAMWLNWLLFYSVRLAPHLSVCMSLFMYISCVCWWAYCCHVSMFVLSFRFVVEYGNANVSLSSSETCTE